MKRHADDCWLCGVVEHPATPEPTTAVATSALDALRRALEFGPYGAQEGATKFLAAVDVANGDGR